MYLIYPIMLLRFFFSYLNVNNNACLQIQSQPNVVLQFCFGLIPMSFVL